MKKLLVSPLRMYLKSRFHGLTEWMQDPFGSQKELLDSILLQARNTIYGREHGLEAVIGYEQYRATAPVVEYEAILPYIERMLASEPNVLVPGTVVFFAKSSGTTSRRSKYIPVTKQYLKNCLTKGSWDTMSILYQNFPEQDVLEYRSLILGGSLEYRDGPKTVVAGDVSAIMLYNMPLVSRPFHMPDLETAIMPSWDEKLNKVAKIGIEQNDVGMISGVPTWNIVLFNKILQLTGYDHMGQVWPNMSTYIHGGVNFAPYRSQFDDYFPDRNLIYQQVYNASEGFFASQWDPESDDMLLLLDNGIFYEFLPLGIREEAGVIPLEEVEVGVHYVMIISTLSGLYRYNLGDTIVFTSISPFKIKITGRTKNFINAFGEEIMEHNTDQALNLACQEHEAQIMHYTVAPKYIDGQQKGRHDWYIEFVQSPRCLSSFAQSLDDHLQALNSDYAAKRSSGIALETLVVHQLHTGTIDRWLLHRKIAVSGQTKIPKLKNDRSVVDEIFAADQSPIQLSSSAIHLI